MTTPPPTAPHSPAPHRPQGDWPDIRTLPRPFRTRQHPACTAAQMLIEDGDAVLESFEFRLKYPLDSHDLAQIFQRLGDQITQPGLSAEAQISGCGWVLHQWFDIRPT